MDDLIKCSIISPQTSYLPVLSFRCTKKPMFCMCRSCVLNYASGDSEHTKDEERAVTGTWLLDEVRLALEKCYKIREIYAIY